MSTQNQTSPCQLIPHATRHHAPTKNLKTFRCSNHLKPIQPKARFAPTNQNASSMNIEFPIISFQLHFPSFNPHRRNIQIPHRKCTIRRWNGKYPHTLRFSLPKSQGTQMQVKHILTNEHSNSANNKLKNVPLKQSHATDPTKSKICIPKSRRIKHERQISSIFPSACQSAQPLENSISLTKMQYAPTQWKITTKTTFSLTTTQSTQMRVKHILTSEHPKPKKSMPIHLTRENKN